MLNWQVLLPIKSVYYAVLSLNHYTSWIHFLPICTTYVLPCWLNINPICVWPKFTGFNLILNRIRIDCVLFFMKTLYITPWLYFWYTLQSNSTGFTILHYITLTFCLGAVYDPRHQSHEWVLDAPVLRKDTLH